jgi:hypothetical protein
VQQNNLPYYAEVLWIRPWTLQPDRLALFPPEEVSEGYTFETVGQKYVLSDGTRTMEILQRPGASARTGYAHRVPAPGEVGDGGGFTPPAQGAPMPTMVTASHRTFCNNVQRLNVHGGRTCPWAEFAKFVTNGKPATNRGQVVRVRVPTCPDERR